MHEDIVATERIPVAFQGEGSGTGVLSWGQREIWLAMVNQRDHLGIGGRKPLPPGTRVEEIADELRYLMTRYPPMRTKLRFPADDPERPTQELFASGVIDLEVFDVADGEDPDAVAAVLEHRYKFEPFDLAGAWPVRMGVTRQGGCATHMIIMMPHIVSDAGGGSVMLREVETRETGPVPGMQQLEQVRWQSSPEGRKHLARTMRYYGELLRRIPTRQVPGPFEPRTPRYWAGDLDSTALPIALKAVAERTQADSSAVLMVLFAASLSRITGIHPVVLRPVVHNRFRPQLAGVMCMVAQAGCSTLEVAGIGVDEAVVRAQQATMLAYKHAYFDPYELNELVAEVAKERDPELDISTFFNDRRMGKGRNDEAIPAASRDLLAQTRAASTFEWTDRQDNPFDRVFLHVDDSPGDIKLRICFDTAYLQPEEAERLVRNMEALAVEAALTPDAPTGVPQ